MLEEYYILYIFFSPGVPKIFFQIFHSSFPILTLSLQSFFLLSVLRGTNGLSFHLWLCLRDVFILQEYLLSKFPIESVQDDPWLDVFLNHSCFWMSSHKSCTGPIFLPNGLPRCGFSCGFVYFHIHMNCRHIEGVPVYLFVNLLSSKS